MLLEEEERVSQRRWAETWRWEALPRRDQWMFLHRKAGELAEPEQKA